MNPRILFLGVGKMGLPMAGHLQKAGHALQVHDLDEVRLKLAQQAGLSLAGDVAVALKQSDWILSSLPQMRQVGMVILDTSLLML